MDSEVIYNFQKKQWLNKPGLRDASASKNCIQTCFKSVNAKQMNFLMRLPQWNWCGNRIWGTPEIFKYTRDGRERGAPPRAEKNDCCPAPPRPAKYHYCPALPRPAPPVEVVKTAGRLRGKMKTLKLWEDKDRVSVFFQQQILSYFLP